MLGYLNSRLSVATAALLLSGMQANAAITSTKPAGDTFVSNLLNAVGVGYGITAIFGLAAVVAWAAFFESFNTTSAISNAWKPILLTGLAFQWANVLGLFGF